MPVPTSEEVFSYAPVDLPVVNSDPAQTKPIGVGPVATGGNIVDIKVNVGPFAGPVNVSFVVYAPALDFDDLYFMRGNDLKLLSEAVDEDSEISGQDSDSDNEDGHDSHRSHNFGNLVTWKHNVTGVNENIYTGPVSDLPSGLYTLVLVVKSQTDKDQSYRWVTHITIP